ncbi:hypothetical protein, partial [Aquimarina megaterium]|uniref:hypothetical protein n=1 Tax=Aquimarina megaterium TaxID=1443666 RepID=UPI0005550FD7
MKSNFFKYLFTLALIYGLVSCENEKADILDQNINQDIHKNDETNLGNLFFGRKSSSDCHFEYEGPEGPVFWADLCGEDWKDCAGNAQSPID